MAARLLAKPVEGGHDARFCVELRAARDVESLSEGLEYRSRRGASKGRAPRQG